MRTNLVRKLIFLITVILLPMMQQSLADETPLAQSAVFPLKIGGTFQLIDHTGQTRTEQDFIGRYMLVYFGYTYCPNICPTDLQKITTTLEQLGDRAAHIQPLFITIDPARDRPDLLKEYVANFHSSFIGLTGSEAQIRAVAKTYKVHRVKVPMPDAGPDEYLVNHSAFIYLMGEDGQLLTLFPYATDQKKMTETIQKYVPA